MLIDCYEMASVKRYHLTKKRITASVSIVPQSGAPKSVCISQNHVLDEMAYKQKAVPSRREISRSGLLFMLLSSYRNSKT